MEKNTEYFMNLIYTVLKNESSLDSISKLIDPNYKDKNGNGLYHYFSEYSLEKFYKINYNQNKNELIKEEKYKEIVEEYKKHIPLYMEILDELKCEFLCLNKEKTSPLIYSLINRNYYITKEYIKKLNEMNLITEDIMHKVFNMCMHSGNCLRKDCIQLIVYILFLSKEKKINLFEKEYLDNNIDKEEDKLPMFLLLAKDYNINIFEKFNSIVETKISKYADFYFGTSNQIIKENFLAEVRRDAKDELRTFINKIFVPLISVFIVSEYDLYTEKKKFYNYFNALFLYLKRFPFNDGAFLIERYNVDINYQDSFGQTPFMYLILNKKKIIKISGGRYYETFLFFLKNNNLKIELTNNKGISAFELSILKGNFIDTISIYMKFNNYKLLFHFEILIFIINYINQTKEYTKIVNFMKYFRRDEVKKKIDFNDFNSLNGRTLFHYINIFSPEDNKKLYIYKTILFELIKLPIDLNKKDIFKRNGLFYLFIGSNEERRKQDPYLKLELCLKICGINDLNDVDIYGNSLIFYAVQIKAYKSIKILLEYKVSLSLKNKEGNTIYSIASILGDYDLFVLLYDANKDNSIFLQKVYSSQQFESNKIKYKNYIESLMDLHKSMKVSIPDKIIFKEQLSKEDEKYFLKDKQYSDKKIFISNFKSNYIELLNDEIKKLLYDNNKEIMIENDDENIDFFVEKQYLMEIKENFMKDSNQFLEQINKGKSVLLGDTLFQYCKLKEYENICGFILNNNYHLISVCKDLLSLKKENEFNYYIHRILYEKDLLNYKNEENTNIFHILSKIQNNLTFYKKNNLDKYNISNLYDDLGNTPIYYACHKLNISFIEIFSNYSFSSINNDSKNVKYSLFIETKNKTCPLKSLYLQLDKKENKILKFIIDISINTKKVYILHILLFLIKNYKFCHKKYFNLPYKDNINNNDYIIKIIGLFLFYKEELKGNFSNEELQGINPIFLCFNNKNFDFLFDILMKQKNIEINNRNKDGKSLIHLIVEMKEDKKNYNFSKKDILIKALDYGLDFKIKDNNGKEPIYYAIINKDNDIWDILLKKQGKNEAYFPK